jgi:hypothetical protein
MESSKEARLENRARKYGRESKLPDLGDGTILVTLPEFRYLTTERLVIE